MSTDGSSQRPVETCSVAIVGGGTAGLALATELKQLGIDDLIIIEREDAAGGVPRHCGHYPFGVREFRKLQKGPAYAQSLIDAARQANVRIVTGTTVSALHPGARLSLSDKNRQYQLQAERVVLCTGTREATRAQRFIGGERPQGVLPTGALQSMVYLQKQKPFLRPVILGTELVSLSAIMTCRHMGIRPVAMLEENARITAPRYMRPYPFLKGIPVHLNASDIHIEGRQQVEAVRFTDQRGVQQRLATDGVIVSGQFQPESALLRGSHLAIDPATGGPVIDQYYRSSDPSFFCTGNVLRPVETSAWCWQEGRQTAQIIADELRAGSPDAAHHSVTIALDNPNLKLVLPQRLSPPFSSKADGDKAMQHAQLRLRRPVKGQLVFSSGDKMLWSASLDSVPERRILAPLQPLLDHASRVSGNNTISVTVVPT